MDGQGQQSLERGITGKRVPWITVGVTVVVIVLQLVGPLSGRWLEWRTDWLTRGDYWRLFSGHFVHWSWDHAIWDLGAFAALGFVLERRGPMRFGLVVCSAILITNALLWTTSRFDCYRGLSAITMGLFAMSMIELMRSGLLERSERTRTERGGGNRGTGRFGYGGMLAMLGILGWCGLLAKVAFEHLAGDALFVSSAESGFSVAVESHLAGVVSPAAVWVWESLIRRDRGRSDPVAADRCIRSERTGMFN